MITIYLIRNTKNSKLYIGQTKHTLNQRFNEHKSCARRRAHNCYKLENAINKYGVENFFIETILTTNDQTEANDAETLYIKKYDSITNGYNIQSGGQGNRDIGGARNPHAKLTEKEMEEIFHLASNKIKPQLEIARQFNVNRSTVQRILYNQSWISEKRTKVNVQRKLTTDNIQEIKKLLTEGTLSKVNIAKMYNVSKSMIGHIAHGRYHSDVK